MAVDEALTPPSAGRRRGGWKTIPFILGAKMAVGVAVWGLCSNLTVYLIQQFNIPSIDAAQINNIVMGSANLAPVVSAVVADAGPGCFHVFWGAAAASFLGSLMFVLISVVPALRPPPCMTEFCEGPTAGQLAFLCMAVALILAGIGGTRYISATFGASQFDDAGEQATFFKWYVGASYSLAVIELTAIVYVQSNVSWTWGFSLSVALSVVGLFVFLAGNRGYRHPAPQKNPFLILLRVITSTIGRRKMTESFNTSINYDNLSIGQNPELHSLISCASSEKHAIDGQTKGVEVVQEDLSSLFRLLPIMLTGIIVTISNSILCSLTILQALVMNRKLSRNFTIPASSMLVFVLGAAVLSLSLLERVIFPFWERIVRHRRPTTLQRIGTGYFFAILAVAVAATVESRRLEALYESSEPMSVLWLVPGLALLGLAESLFFPGQLSFYSEELPDSLSNTATGMIALVGAIGDYASTGVIALVKRTSSWFQDDTNRSRFNYVYWMVVIGGMLNLGIFMGCARLYKKKKEDETESFLH